MRKALLLTLAVVALVGCGKQADNPTSGTAENPQQPKAPQVDEVLKAQLMANPAQLAVMRKECSEISTQARRAGTRPSLDDESRCLTVLMAGSEGAQGQTFKGGSADLKGGQ
uniref:hypothetical protein n=1 Tax=Laribacter hongkongensis TaxID=168471 RepID=UPI00155DA3BE|nr:hypothetical protein [Laribacter hongkongensis]